jgi:hypothetical protein
MLLSACSRATNTGFQWNEPRNRATQQGGPPTLIEPISGAITLNGLRSAKSVSIAALDGLGKAGKAAPASKTREAWSFQIGEPVTTWYVVTVAR